MQTQIRLISVVDPAELIIGPPYGLAERTGRTEEMKKERAQDAISAANRILDSAGFNLTWDVLKGDAKTRIIDEALGALTSWSLAHGVGAGLIT
jgi:hypothetical protein